MEIYDISWSNLALGYIALIIPLFVLYYFQTGILKDALIATGRMTIQLFLVGLYLEYVFRINNIWVNIAWVFIMIIIASLTSIRRSDLPTSMFIMPISFSMLAGLIIADAFYLGMVIRPDNLFTARYFIPISGMMIGNSMERNIIALSQYKRNLSQNTLRYQYSLANGASRQEALMPFMRESLKGSFSPFIANMATIGLIALPGTMTGQILGGSSPNEAIKYQIMLLLSIFVVTVVSVILTLLISQKIMFDTYNNPKEQIFKNKKN